MTTTIAHAWTDRATCTTYDPELFYPDTGRHDLVKLAKRICSTCPVKDQCLAAAMAEEGAAVGRFGIRGGMTAQERRRAALSARPTEQRSGAPCVRGHLSVRLRDGNCGQCRLEVDDLREDAARLLGVSVRQFLADHGYSRSAAETVIKEYES